MASRQPPRYAKTLTYFDQYDYPLTRPELSFWLHKEETTGSYESDGKYFFLPGRKEITKVRLAREAISKKKWELARLAGERIKKFPTVLAVFVTGSLAMNNAQVDDDIDLMVVTSANSLWITRVLTNLLFFFQRRLPGQKTAPDRLCFNLWLDEKNLHITPRDLYRAHEILQAKIVWDKGNIASRFLTANPWIHDFLPNAHKSSETINYQLSIFNLVINFVLSPINLIFFVAQYIYMKPKITSERVGLGFAFFHPQKPS